MLYGNDKKGKVECNGESYKFSPVQRVVNLIHCLIPCTCPKPNREDEFITLPGTRQKPDFENNDLDHNNPISVAFGAFYRS